MNAPSAMRTASIVSSTLAATCASVTIAPLHSTVEGRKEDKDCVPSAELQSVTSSEPTVLKFFFSSQNIKKNKNNLITSISLFLFFSSPPPSILVEISFFLFFPNCCYVCENPLNSNEEQKKENFFFPFFKSIVVQ